MEKVISTEKVPIKMWLDDLEESALVQAKNVANLPFIFKHVVILPDSHCGFGVPIGCVMTTKDVIIPNAVGKDVSCGVVVCKTSLTELDNETIKKILGKIRKVIPVGLGKIHSNMQDISLMPSLGKIFDGIESSIVSTEFNNARKSLGTLGSGNHFLSLEKGSDGHIWIMIHSGSRNLGSKVADYYNNIAKELNKKWFSSVPSNIDLAFLPFNSKEGATYFAEMQYCGEYAKANRSLMLSRVKDCIVDCVSNVNFDLTIDVPHNYAAFENHFGKNVIVHRKGAIRAREGEYAIIPGSQGSASFIAIGKGEKESFQSCSHGAGRKLSRTKAKSELNLEYEKKRLDTLGIIHNIRTEDDLQEATGAYKDINKVMENQKDLVDIFVELKPLATIKG